MVWRIEDKRTGKTIVRGELTGKRATPLKCKAQAIKTLEKELPFLNPANLYIVVDRGGP